MHGIIHKTLEKYVMAKTDEETWASIVDQADIEPTLYLSVSSYDDAEIEAILETLSSLAVQDRRQIERDFGRTLAPELLSTFAAHVRDDGDLFAVLERLESIVESVDTTANATAVPVVSGTRESPDSVRVTYRTHREPCYCGMAQGVLEGMVDAFETDATVTELSCPADGDRTCVFRVERA
ncbi:heme NO-binding domain-containing protein [Natronorubrum thiooxidans]|uniref:Haem-NO-binding n=1 Tax=Natronorubrum thiooxidans TaxID=308853 RepID=A0A1N7GCC5_9EURY|nr:heme NO-binding domain-containing protein [Natronorubrum thiooxidans]SIS10176.1 Haem-NO-binding [Natronorubrum thiooxidans]